MNFLKMMTNPRPQFLQAYHDVVKLLILVDQQSNRYRY